MRATAKRPTRNVVPFPQRDTKISTGYRWIDKDPMLDFVLEAIHRSGMSFTQIEHKTGVTSSTLRKWDTGETRKPRRETMDIILRVLGYEFGIYKSASKRRVL